MERLPRLARRARTVLVVLVMVAATLLAPVALPVGLVVRWICRDDRRIEHVIAAPNVRLLRRPGA